MINSVFDKGFTADEITKMGKSSGQKRFSFTQSFRVVSADKWG
jgi:hypothetical protein